MYYRYTVFFYVRILQCKFRYFNCFFFQNSGPEYWYFLLFFHESFPSLPLFFVFAEIWKYIYIYKNLRGDAIDTAVLKTKIKTVSHVAPILLLINNIYYCSFASVSTRSWDSVLTILSCFLYRNQCRSNFSLRLDLVPTAYFESY